MNDINYTYIKDLNGKTLYKGEGSFQEILEKAVAENVPLPRADLRNQEFNALFLDGAKLQGASFENSSINTMKSCIINSDLRNVSFKNTKIEFGTFLANSDVENADFDSHHFTGGHHIETASFLRLKNFDKAYNITQQNLQEWFDAQPIIEKEREKLLQKSNIKEDEQVIVNKKPLTVIKNLNSETIYEGEGSVQTLLEEAALNGVPLLNADLRNQEFFNLKIPNANLEGASFEGSHIEGSLSDLSNSNLKKVSFADAKIDDNTNFKNSDVENADFSGHHFTTITSNFKWLVNFDKAYNITKNNLDDWTTAQPNVERKRSLAQKRNQKTAPVIKKQEIVNNKNKINIASLINNNHNR